MLGGLKGVEAVSFFVSGLRDALLMPLAAQGGQVVSSVLYTGIHVVVLEF